MKNKESLKLLPWNKKDIALISITYLINYLVFIGLFALIYYASGQTLNTFFKATESLSSFLVILFLIMAATFLYFYFEDRDFLKSAANSQMLFLILQLGLVFCFLSKDYINAYLRPLAFVAIITLFLCGTRHAIFNNFIFAITLLLFECYITGAENIYFPEITSLMANTICAGIIAVYLIKNVYSRLKLILLSFCLSIPSLITDIILTDVYTFASMWKDLASSIASGPLAMSLVILFLPMFEFVFGKLTCFKLAELTDHKAKYIRKMISSAPGTFNHAIIVSNLAEACATAIGEDALLARTCAYYHDIGKLRRPEFFKENQADGDNPHDDITPELSANIIKSHTIDGYHYALKNRLPREVADVVLQHHGTLPIIYFYDKAKKFTDGEVSLAQYCYPGPKPQTKIAAILMIADSCEAAARLLKDRSRENVLKTIKSIVNDRMKLGQFDECEITLKEINIIIHTMANTLSGVHHSRIEYPKITIDSIDFDLSVNKQEM